MYVLTAVSPQWAKCLIMAPVVNADVRQYPDSGHLGHFGTQISQGEAGRLFSHSILIETSQRIYSGDSKPRIFPAQASSS
jgi:hypothetical protein